MAAQILCDFDGTVALEDVTDLILENFADRGWIEIEQEWRAGRIGSAACMARQVELVEASRAELDALLDTIDIDPYFPAFARFCAMHRVALTIVSDGLDYAIARILRNHGLGDLPIIANRLVARGDKRYLLEHPHAASNCAVAAGTCKCAAARRHAMARGPFILIGDGGSDFCAAAAVDAVFAKDALRDYCEASGITHDAFTTFAEVPRLVRRVMSEIGAAAAPGRALDEVVACG